MTPFLSCKDILSRRNYLLGMELIPIL